MAHRKDRRTTTGETTSHLTDGTTSHSTRLPKDGSQVAGYKLANYANQVIGYALADAALKNGSKSSCINIHSGFSPFFALPQLRSLRCATVFQK